MILRSDRVTLLIGIAFLGLLILAIVSPPQMPSPTWNPWQLVLGAGTVSFFLTFIALSHRTTRARFSRNKWPVAAIGGFVFLVGILPILILVWPSPSYYTQSASLSDNLATGVRFVSNGPMAAGNPIYAAVVSFQAFCPPWNVSSITMWIYGLNRSTGGIISVGPTSVDFRTCNPSDQPTEGLVYSTIANGSIVFYSSGYMPVLGLLNARSHSTIPVERLIA